MELTYSELSEVLLNIFTGSEIIRVNKGSRHIDLLLKQPSNTISLRAISVYNNAYADALKEGLMSAEEIEQLIIDRNIFTDNDQLAINKLESKLEAQKVLLSKTTKVRAHSDRIKKLINSIEEEIITIKSKKYGTLMMSAENHSENDKNNFLCSQCVYDLDENLYWDSYDSFINHKDSDFRYNILNSFTRFYAGIPTDIIRFIARNSLWRIRYVNSQKVADPLFGVASSNYTNDQLNLAYWSNYYQNIYEMMPEDKPSDNVIDDDEALDAFMSSYYEERQKDEISRKRSSKVDGKLSSFDGEEIIVTQFDEMAEEIKYDKPREANRIKDRTDIRKKTRRRRN